MGCGVWPSFQSVRLAPHLPCPSVHLPIAHKPTPSNIIALTIHYTVLAHLLARWDHNSPFNTRNNGLDQVTTEIHNKWLNSRTKCCWLSPVKLLYKVKQHQQNNRIFFFFETDRYSTSKHTTLQICKSSFESVFQRGSALFEKYLKRLLEKMQAGTTLKLKI